MPKLYSSKEVIKVLIQKGFIFISQKGSHVKYRKKEKEVFTAIVPANKKEIPFGTFRSILRQAGINEEEFKKEL
jgi:predicted RNA binding protein YcfA (HicA-like mRNA interferase family)